MKRKWSAWEYKLCRMNYRWKREHVQLLDHQTIHDLNNDKHWLINLALRLRNKLLRIKAGGAR